MRVEEIQKTDIWHLYELGENYHNMVGIYADTDKNYRFYNGNQWYGALLGDIEPIQKNFIKAIVKYKLSVIHDNLYAPIFSYQNYENRDFGQTAQKLCEMLNRHAALIWERDQMDTKGRGITKDAAINDEGILYVNFDEKSMLPVNEIIKKNDIYYGNENDEDIQSQPYILIRKRMPEVLAVEFALAMGMSPEDTEFLKPDGYNFEQSGEAAKKEVEDKVTIVYKLYKHNGTVHYAVSSQWVDILEDTDTGLSLYPVAHFTWEEKEGSARGEGEVRFLIPNQIEVNRTETRRAMAVKNMAYPQKVVDTKKIANPGALNTVGGIIKTNGQPVEDIHKAVGVIPPAQMSPDVRQFQEDLINITRELSGAGDIATGQVNPEDASGRAILAVQQASQSPMTEQKERYKKFIEDVARIWFEYLLVYSENGIDLQEEVKENGETYIQMVHVEQNTLKQMQATVKVDVTPRSVYDRFAQERTIENMFTGGFFNAQKLQELEIYAELLEDDAVAPKKKIMEAAKRMREQQMQIAQIESQGQLMKQRAFQFINSEPEVQAEQIMAASNIPSEH